MAERSGIRALPKSTSRVIASSQVISSVVSVVKELIENSLDAGGSNIEIRLENFGFDKIEVRDNGSGISPSDAEFMGRPHYTSKLSETQDLETLATYGFRGEALGSLCSVADVAITTKTESDEFGKTYKLDKEGIITDTQPSHLGQGTTVVATHLFRNVPVRKQYYSAPKRKKEELRKVEDLLIAYSIIKYDVRFLLRHNRDTLWQKTAVGSTKDVLLKVFGTTSMASMMHIQRKGVDPEFDLELCLPKPSADVNNTSRTSSDRCFICINQRPVTHKDIEKTLKRYYCQAMDTDQSRYPMAFVSIVVPPSGVDVNLEPNKTRVLIQSRLEVLEMLEDILEECYVPVITRGEGKDPTSEISHDSVLVERTRGVLDGHQDTTRHSNCDVQGQPSNGSHNTAADCPRLITERLERGGQVGGRSDSADGLESEGQVGDRLDPADRPETRGQLGDRLDPADRPETRGQLGDRLDPADRPETRGQLGDRLDPADRPETRGQLGDRLDPADRPETRGQLGDRLDPADRPETRGQLGHRSETRGQLGDRLDPADRSAAGFSGVEPLPMSNTDTSPTLNPCNLQACSQSMTFNLDLSLPDDCEVIDDNLSDSALLNDILLIEEQAMIKEEAATQSEPVGEKPMMDQLIGPHDGSKHSERESVPVTGPESRGGMMEENGGARGWSRGECLQDVDQKRVEPVQILLPGARQPVDKTPIRGANHSKQAQHTPVASIKKKQAANTPGQATLYDVVGSEPIKRPTTAFIFFSKEVRPAVVESNPGAEFREIAKIIGERWKALTEDERQKYEQLMSNDVIRYREEKSFREESHCKGSQGMHLKRRKIDVNNISHGTPKLSPTSVRKGAKFAPRKKVPMPFSLYKLKEKFASGFKSSLQISGDSWSSHASLVGELKPSGSWVSCDREKLILVVPNRAQEVLIYSQLMESHTLPTERLESPILLSASSALLGGEDLWGTLSGLVTSQLQPTDPYRYCTDPRITRNGFSLRYSNQGQDSDLKVEVTSMASCINTYGFSDLCQILKVVQESPEATVTQTRPTKVKHYLQGEAVRMTRQMPPRVSKEEVQEILEQVQTRLPNGTRQCFHHRPFLYELYSLTDLSSSQA